MNKRKKDFESNLLSEKILDLIFDNNTQKLNEKINTDKNVLLALNKDGQNIFIISIIYERYDVSFFLLDHFNFDLDLRDKIGWSALHYAVTKRNILLIDKLIENNADIEVKDNYENTPLLRATFESKGYGDIIKILLKYGAKPDAKNIKNISALDLAKTIANYNIIQFFDM